METPVIDGSYDPALLELEDRADDRHFWFRGRRNVISRLAAKLVADRAPGYWVVELGCGNGGVLKSLRATCSKGVVVGLDLSEEGLHRTRHRSGGALVLGDVLRPPFARVFQLVGLFDVLEHLADDYGVLSQAFDMLVPGGALLVTVPAHPSLWSYADEASCHYRRYTSAELRAKLTKVGFQVEYLSSFMTLLFPLMWLGRRVARIRFCLKRRVSGENRRLAAAELRIVPGVNEVLTGVLSVESILLARRWRLPFGSSLVAIGRRPMESFSTPATAPGSCRASPTGPTP